MERLNLTPDADTSAARERLPSQKKLALEYASGRADARALLQDLERSQLELLTDDA